MKTPNAARSSQFVSSKELAEILGVTLFWIYQRTGPKARRSPKLPSEPWFGELKFDLNKVMSVLNAYCGSRITPSTPRSLKTKESVEIMSPKQERTYEKLW